MNASFNWLANKYIFTNTPPILQINFSSLPHAVVSCMCYKYRVEGKAEAGKKPKNIQ